MVYKLRIIWKQTVASSQTASKKTVGCWYDVEELEYLVVVAAERDRDAILARAE